jgi:hypothetical protein
MAGRSRKSRSGLVGSAATVVIIGACIIGFYNIPSDPDLEALPEMLKSKSATVDAWMQNCVPNVVESFDFSRCSMSSNVQTGGGVNIEFPDSGVPMPGTGNPAPAPGPQAPGKPNATAANDALAKIPVSKAEKVDYDRDDWNHWISQGSSCWDTRDQVLYDEAVKDNTLVLAAKSGSVVTDVKQACSVKSGTWNDPYSGTTITNPKELDVDHMIPLSYTAQHGGQKWDAKKKEEYANNLSNPSHLIAVKASENRTKSDKGPSEWKPTNKANYCTYANDWIGISANYGLTMTADDAKALKEMLATC